MNKEFKEEMIKKIHEPIVVNSITYKYFDEDNYNKILYFVENEQSYIEYIEFVNNELQQRIDKAIEVLEQDGDEYQCVDYMGEAIRILQGE